MPWRKLIPCVGILAAALCAGQAIASDPPVLVNVSALGYLPNDGSVAMGDGGFEGHGAALTLGWVIGSSTPDDELPALLRLVGPSLSQFGVPMPLAQVGGLLWSYEFLMFPDVGFLNSPQVAAIAAQVGAFPLPDSGGDEQTIMGLTAGNYTLTAISPWGQTGNAMIEFYDYSSPPGSGEPPVINCSALGWVGPQHTLTLGFVLAGSESKQLLVRAVGPGLSQFGVAQPQAAPLLFMFDSSGAQVPGTFPAPSGATPQAATAAQAVGAFPLPPAAADSALVVTVAPGAYTVQLAAGAATLGQALVEVYVIP